MAENTYAEQMRAYRRLIGRCMVAYTDAAPNHLCNRDGIRAVIEHIAAELVVANQRNPGRLSAHDAAQWLLSQLQEEVIPLRPANPPGDAA